MMSRYTQFAPVSWLVVFLSCQVALAQLDVTIQVRAGESLGEMPQIWRFFGADEPNYAYAPNGAKLIGELGSLAPQRIFFRAHNLLTTGDGTPALKWGSTNAYRESDAGEPIYDWTILDRIFDTYLQHGVRPYAQIGFMPQALSVKPNPYQHRWRVGAPYEEIYTGWAYPPKDYRKWENLVAAWVAHCVDRYGVDEVNQWYWETWNEPNIPYWQGTREEFFKLHDHAIAGVKRALPTARVGGPDVAGHGGEFMRQFLEHCLNGPNAATGESTTPLDFVSFHAKGAPQHVDGHVRMGMREQLRTIEEGFHLISNYPQLKSTPVIIGESDPEGCAACQGPQLAYRNGTMYSSYTAAVFARKCELAVRHDVKLEGALTWAFEFEDQPYFAGFRSLATRGVDKPVLNVFRLFAQMVGQRVAATSSQQLALDQILRDGVHDQPDVGVFACRDRDVIQVMLWHYHDDDVAGPNAHVRVNLTGLDPQWDFVRLLEQRIDQTHANAFTAWLRLGSPQQPTPAQYAELQAASQLVAEDELVVPCTIGQVNCELDLPRQAVTLLKIRPRQ